MVSQGAEERVKVSDGFSIFWRRWLARDHSQRAIICLSGLPGESAQFSLLAEGLAAAGSDVYAPDLRGFGNSVEQGLPRGEVKDFKRHLQDIDDLVRNVKEAHQGKHVFILGHSIGGNYALWYAATQGASIDGVVLLAPGARLTSKQPATDMLGLLFSMALAPSKTYDLQRAFSKGVRSSEELKVLLEDPLVTTRLSVRYLGGLRGLITKVSANASRVDKPVLVLQGDADVWVYPQGAKELLGALASKDKSLETRPGEGHFFSDILLPQMASPKGAEGREELTATINGWLGKR